MYLCTLLIFTYATWEWVRVRALPKIMMRILQSESEWFIKDVHHPHVRVFERSGRIEINDFQSVNITENGG